MYKWHQKWKHVQISKFHQCIPLTIPSLLGVICSLPITAFHSKILAPGFLSFSPTILVSGWSYYLHNCSNSLVSQFFVYHSSIHSWGQTVDLTITSNCKPSTRPQNILSPLQLPLSNVLSLNSLTLQGPTVHWSYYHLITYCSATHVLTSHLTHHKFYNQIL